MPKGKWDPSSLLWGHQDLKCSFSRFPSSFILESMFQEIAIDSGDVLFEWASLNFVNLSASYVLPGTTDVSGNGTFTQPWDYL